MKNWLGLVGEGVLNTVCLGGVGGDIQAFVLAWLPGIFKSSGSLAGQRETDSVSCRVVITHLDP